MQLLCESRRNSPVDKNQCGFVEPILNYRNKIVGFKYCPSDKVAELVMEVPTVFEDIVADQVVGAYCYRHFFEMLRLQSIAHKMGIKI